jgi:hypothetical protein
LEENIKFHKHFGQFSPWIDFSSAMHNRGGLCGPSQAGSAKKRLPALGGAIFKRESVKSPPPNVLWPALAQSLNSPP